MEWTDTNTSNATFEGTARELMRLRHNTRIHPMGDLIFNPTARPGDPDWRVLYVACGDGGSGERNGEMRSNPAAAGYIGRENPPYHSGFKAEAGFESEARSRRWERWEHGQRKRTLSHPQR